jgi:GGDEF domain-containing protein
MLEERLVKAAQQLTNKTGRPYHISMSIGILTCDDFRETLSIVDLLARADALMYEQKREHKNAQNT